MTHTPKPDLSEHDEEATPFDDVMRKLLDAKSASRRDRKGGEEMPATESPKS